MSLLQWSYFIQITRFRKSVFIDQKKKHILVKSKKKHLINQEKSIFAKDIDHFIILIDLIFRQNVVIIEKFEFAFFASMYARHLQFQSFLAFFTRLTCFLNLSKSNCMNKNQWNRHVEKNIWNIYETSMIIQRNKN